MEAIAGEAGVGGKLSQETSEGCSLEISDARETKKWEMRLQRGLGVLIEGWCDCI